MLPRADIAGAKPVAATEATRPIIPTGDAHQELAQRLGRVALGTAFQAEILSRLNDGSFMVKVADTPVRMNLPEGAQVGEKVDLTLVAKQPQPAFQLYRPPVNGSTASVSNAGRLVDWILHAAKDTGAPTVLIGKAPLLPAAGAAPAQLASAMKDTLTFSGLFYESHLGKWAGGEHPLMALMAEPQAKNSDLQKVFAALRAAAPSGDIKEAHAAQPTAGQTNMAKPDSAPASVPPLNAGQLTRLLASLHEHPEMASSLMDALRTAMQSESNQPPAQATSTADTDAVPASPSPSMDALPVADATSGTSLPSANATTATGNQADLSAAVRPETMDNESVRMINLQLTTLEQQRVVWQGELWPGQRMEWEIGEETHGRKEGGAAEERAWQSVVRMELPSLGAISASVRLAGNALQIQVRAASDATAALLRENGNTLSSALDAAGSPLELLTVKRDEAA